MEDSRFSGLKMWTEDNTQWYVLSYFTILVSVNAAGTLKSELDATVKLFFVVLKKVNLSNLREHSNYEIYTSLAMPSLSHDAFIRSQTLGFCECFSYLLEKKRTTLL